MSVCGSRQAAGIGFRRSGDSEAKKTMSTNAERRREKSRSSTFSLSVAYRRKALLDRSRRRKLWETARYGITLPNDGDSLSLSLSLSLTLDRSIDLSISRRERCWHFWGKRS
ncbi:hypothetical protein AXF42_Ash017708 [Apostasia shenzhenica]|uniref:Uncharacterized protein n=1 Tax=Apostasia shenzhenica TaxID=1088818 RepID=A0A2I0B634_9ASPA|nr:hypothetical protein AXF42_Ash017708 [Apostasia shenzhenica]